MGDIADIFRGSTISLSAVAPTPIHCHDLLTIIIPIFCLFFMFVVIFALNLFKASFSSSSGSGPGYIYTPGIHIIEPTRSVSAREVIRDHDDEV
jgi:hypothetical protein